MARLVLDGRAGETSNTNGETRAAMAFTLPHEVIDVLCKLGNADVILCNAGLDPCSQAHLQDCQRKAQCDLVALGLWCDGVPCNYDRTDTMAVVSINLPGQTGQYKPLRIPLVAFSRKDLSPNTFDDIMAVIAWSLRCLAAGVKPSARHDGSAWRQSGRKRKMAHGKLPLRAALVEVRGDWVMFAEVFKFPHFDLKTGCCWLCHTTPAQASLAIPPTPGFGV